MNKRTAWVLVALMALGGLVFWGSATGASSHSPQDWRYERASIFENPWEASCDSHGCGIPTIGAMRVGMPSNVVRVDVVVTVSLDYKTSPSDWGAVRTSFKEGSDGSLTPMNPRNFTITSPSPDRLTSTTLVWAKKGLPAAGREYTFQVAVYARDANGDLNASVQGRRLSFVVHMTPSSA